jgi:hypothetical protein
VAALSIVNPSLTPQQFEDKFLRLFADNEFQNITEGTFRQLIQDIRKNFLNRLAVTTNDIRGGLYRIDNVDALSAIPGYMLVVGMTAQATQGGTLVEIAAAEAAGLVLPPATFQLVSHSNGRLFAFVDEKPNTTEKVLCAWVRTSGSDEERIRSYPQLVLEEQPYEAGDVVQHTFENEQTILLEVRRKLPLAGDGTSNPVPTGHPTADLNYKPFAPLLPVTHYQNTDKGTNADLFEIGMSELIDGTGEYYRGLVINKSEGEGKGFLGARVQDADGQPCFELVQCRDFVRGGPNVYEPLGSDQGVPYLVQLQTTEDAYPNRLLRAILSDDNAIAIDAVRLQTLETVAFQDFQFQLNSTKIQPYTFKKGVVYRDLVAYTAYECRIDHTVLEPEYPTDGPLFLEVPYLTKERGEYIANQLAAVPAMIANAPGKIPRFYAYDPSGNQKNGSMLVQVSGFGNGAVVEMFASGSIGGGEFVIRSGSVLKGKGFNLDLTGGKFSHGRDSTLENVNFYNGTLFGFGTVNRSIAGGSLNTTALDGFGGQTWYVYGTRINCAAGFKLLLNGAVLYWHGTKEYPEPVLPDGVDVSEGSVQIINYVAPPGEDNGGTPVDTSGLVSEGSAGPGRYNIVAAGIDAGNDITGQGDSSGIFGGVDNQISDYLDADNGEVVAVPTYAVILASGNCQILGGNRALIVRSETSSINNSSYSTLVGCENSAIINESDHCRIEYSLACSLSSCQDVTLENCTYLTLAGRSNERWVNNVLQSAASDDLVITVLNNGTSAFSDLLQTAHYSLASVSSQYNGTNWQAQLLKADGNAAGPVRNTAATLNSDLEALYATEASVPFYLIRLTLDRLSTSDVAYANFTFKPVT